MSADLDDSTATPWRSVHDGEKHDQLRRIGDMMQSEASRLSSWIDDALKAHPTTLEMPYEVRMALSGVRSAIDDWTEARRRGA